MQGSIMIRWWSVSLVLAVAIAGCSEAYNGPVSATQPQPKVIKDCADCPELVVVPAGTFVMGTKPGSLRNQPDDAPAHEVIIPHAFAVGRFEITYAEFGQFARETGKGGEDWKVAGRPKGGSDRYPVYWVSWEDARDYVQWLSTRTGENYRLLSEAEWEYAARAGMPEDQAWEPNDTMTAYGVSQEQTWLYASTEPVGSHKPNAFGLYDMTGNIPEWTADCYDAAYDVAAEGKAAAVDCAKRAVRGGYTHSAREFQRIANRDWGFAVNRSAGNPTGFRIAKSLP